MDETPHSGDQMPHVIGRYQVQESIGYGAMGAVYKAFDPLIKRTLAIKTIRLDIPKQSPQYKSFIERFYHEARISGTLSHPNIVTLFDIGEELSLPYLAMEFVEGETISAILERGQRFKPEKVIGLVSQVASAIDYAHTKGVIHRDIKPSNLILFDSDRVKVTDFGIAKLVDAEMTQSGTLLGTPSYMSPEQAMGDKLDGRSDIFSLGVCAFEMLCGEQPFPGNNVTSILYKLVHVDPIEPANLEMNGLVPEKWHEVFGRVLAKKPDDRYQTATEFVQDLEYCLGAWFGAVPEDAIPASSGRPAQGASGSGPRSQGDEVTSAMPSLTDPSARKTNPPGLRPATSAGGRSTVPPPSARKTHPPGGGLAGPPSSFRGTPPPPARRTGPPGAPGATGSGPRPSAPRPPEPEGEEPTVYLKAPPPAARRTGATPPPPATEEDGATVVMRGQGGRPSAGRPARAPMPEPEEEEPSTVVIPGSTRRPGSDTGARGAGTAGQRPAPGDRLPPPGRPPSPPMGEPPETWTAPAPVLPEGRPRSVLTLALGGVGLVLFLVVLTTAAIILIQRPPAPDPTPTPVAETTPVPVPTEGVLRVESSPPGATIFVGNQRKGMTPADIELPLASHEVRLELAGYTPSTDVVMLTTEIPRTQLKVTMTVEPPTFGAADVVSKPSGAMVKIDGTSVGVTPLRGHKLKPGSHRIELSSEGFLPWSRSVRVSENRTARVDATLAAIPKPTTPQPVRSPVASTPTPAPPPTPGPPVPETDADVKPQRVASSWKPPEYPANIPQLKPGQRASVTVVFTVTETGETTDIEIVESAGSDVDEAVIAAYRASKWTPGIEQGAKVRVRMTRRRHTFLGGG
jgi:TonB family protein